MSTGAERHSELVEALMNPDAYPESIGSVCMEQTHVSYLFFTVSHVYKVKKAVDFGFLDFTALEKRRYYCEQEVALNSRMSPDVYDGVVPIRERGGRLQIGGPGEAIDYAIKMRRLRGDRALDASERG